MIWPILSLLAFFLLASLAYAAWRGAPWVPTWKRDLKRIERLAQLQETDRFVELGCGTGRVCRHLARTSGAVSHGVELSVLQWAYARLLGLLAFSGKACAQHHIFLADAFYFDLSPYNVVYLFLMPETYKKIRRKLTSELASGARVITYVWPIPGWTPSYVDRVEGSPDLYVYVKK
ncbi:class I SAM-dependent methyltransferase [Candidatus Uhrbacteria bacterium]|nr:class I SAM-dependent methyltransferase [Candidatus Uhrbacteria bacterium]